MWPTTHNVSTSSEGDILKHTTKEFAVFKHLTPRSVSPSQLRLSIHGSIERETKVSKAAHTSLFEDEVAAKCDAQKRHAY